MPIIAFTQCHRNMATGTIQNLMAIEDLSNQVTKITGLMSTNIVGLYRFGNIAIFNFRFKPVSSLPVDATVTHTLPIHPTMDTRNMVAKTNATGGCMVTVRTNGNVDVYPYGGAYSDWVIGQIFFMVA